MRWLISALFLLFANGIQRFSHDMAQTDSWWLICYQTSLSGGQLTGYIMNSVDELRHDKTNKMSVRPAKTRISLGIRQVWSESSLCTQWVAKDPSFLHADSKDSDQIGRMPRLIWVVASRTFILLVLSCRGSDENETLLVMNGIWHTQFIMTRWFVIEKKHIYNFFI